MRLSRWPGTTRLCLGRNAVHRLKGLGDPRLPVERRADEEVYSTFRGCGSRIARGAGAGEEVADTAQTDADPSGHVPPGALTVLVGVHHPETAITCGGSQRQLRAGRLPLRLYRGACQRQPLSEHPEARPRPPSPCPTVAPGGTWRRHGQAAHLVCVTLPGVPASHGQPQSSEEVEPCRD